MHCSPHAVLHGDACDACSLAPGRVAYQSMPVVLRIHAAIILQLSENGDLQNLETQFIANPTNCGQVRLGAAAAAQPATGVGI